LNCGKSRLRRLKTTRQIPLKAKDAHNKEKASPRGLISFVAEAGLTLVLLICYPNSMSITIYSAQVVGLDAKPIAVEVDISPGLHIFSIVGLADKEVQESRERIAAAIKNLGALAPHKKSQRVIVNLAPADIKKEGPAFDLPIAMGYLKRGAYESDTVVEIRRGETRLAATVANLPFVTR